MVNFKLPLIFYEASFVFRIYISLYMVVLVQQRTTEPDLHKFTRLGGVSVSTLSLGSRRFKILAYH